jgi:hypothetical protein
MLSQITDYNHFKDKFTSKFRTVLSKNLEFQFFIFDLLTKGTAYVVGGFLRDLSIGQDSRDLDIIFHLPNIDILMAIKSSNLKYSINRFDGIKVFLQDFEVDLWSIEHNWAFKNNIVTINEDDILESIVNGCFYNYDALAINIFTNNINVRHYNNMVKNNTLDIIQKNDLYKKLNPTIEANILRAFYLHSKFGVIFSNNCKSYLKSRIGYLEDLHGSSFRRLCEFKNKYPKYKSLTDKSILDLIFYCINENQDGQSIINFELNII